MVEELCWTNGSDNSERKAAMAQEAEAFIALFGGYGTMEELLEIIITWAQLGIHKKRVGLLNVDGARNIIIVVSAPSAKELLEKMEMEAAMQISILQPSYRASASRICFVAVFCSDSSPSLRSHSMNAPVLVLKDSLKRESGTKVHHGNIQASKAVADIIRTTLGPRSVLPKHLLNRVTILLSYAEALEAHLQSNHQRFQKVQEAQMIHLYLQTLTRYKGS
ncbi:hypothetical protein Bca52824_023760 [Brassica carinata]|uniref:cytokinin riboside 5'-monophosphate phosphoribohydrolase n=1 Tax=Brassica carinata TaxID=52824 RepID=A0A8X8AV01_BRACI|nr:hypothetical protein Bca52824_023760 [Brassica carinata]